MEEDENDKMHIPVAASAMFPGFRFSPTDEELISFYLKKKIDGFDKCVEVISEVDICKYEPWDLPGKAVIQSENEWFFFSPRGRKYPNGSQSKRATESGYWKATGKERNVKSGSDLIGTKRTLVFHNGRAPKGVRTEWIMHEYCMSGISQDSMVVCRLRKNSEFRLNDTSRKVSPTPGHLSNASASTSVLAQDVEQVGVAEGAKEADLCSKEGSSSYNSHSVDQIDSYSDDQKVGNEVSEHDSSSRQKADDEEEDWFADIMKNDIIELDELPTTSDLLPTVSRNPDIDRKSKQPVQATVPNELPSQGTANRRLRLNWKPVECYHSRQPETGEVTESKLRRSRNFVADLLSKTRVNLRFVVAVILVLFLLLCKFAVLDSSGFVSVFVPRLPVDEKA